MQSVQDPFHFIPPLPAGTMVAEPETIDRLLLRLNADGTISFRGPRARIIAFVNRCADLGLEVRVDYLGLCG